MISTTIEGYRQPSIYIPDSGQHAGQAKLILQTATGLTPSGLVQQPVFFSGSLTRPDVVAAGLLTLVEIASTRYFNPIPGGFASLDPILTANGDRLRCEAFSACNGIYARLDLLADTFATAVPGLGTTNIDINTPLARALAGIRAGNGLHLNIGPDGAEFATPQGAFTERKVNMPERWVRALAETQALASTFAPLARFDAMNWRRFMNGLPMSGGSGAGSTMWLMPTAHGLRPMSKPGSGAIALPGTARLAAIKRVLHWVQAVQVYGPTVHADTRAACSAWEFFLPGARLLLMLSPEPWRGFSGEGALLHALGQALEPDAVTIASLLAWEAVIDSRALAQETRFSVQRVQHALQLLATDGQLGFDLHEQSYFHRLLPYGGTRLHDNYPRLTAARALLAAKAIAIDGERLRVTGEQHDHWVAFQGGTPRCTCLFWSKYQGSRGPCKHILAARLYLDQA